MFKKKKSGISHENFVKHLSENWETIDFPLVTLREGKWKNHNYTLSGLKAMLSQDNMKLYQDYVIIVSTETNDQRYIRIMFKDHGQGLIYLMKWIGSNYYKDRS